MKAMKFGLVSIVISASVFRISMPTAAETGASGASTDELSHQYPIHWVDIEKSKNHLWGNRH